MRRNFHLLNFRNNAKVFLNNWGLNAAENVATLFCNFFKNNENYAMVDLFKEVDDTILNQFENVIPMFEYDMDINSPEDFKLVYHKYCLSAYIDLIFKDTRTKLSPSYSKENLDLIDTFNFKLELILNF